MLNAALAMDQGLGSAKVGNVVGCSSLVDSGRLVRLR